MNRLPPWRSAGVSLVSKVQGHADDDGVLRGRIREMDRIGNDAGAKERASCTGFSLHL